MKTLVILCMHWTYTKCIVSRVAILVKPFYAFKELMIYALSNIVKEDINCIQNYHFNTDLVENPLDDYIFNATFLLKGTT